MVRVELLMCAPGLFTRMVYTAYGAVEPLYSIPFSRKLLSIFVLAET